MPDDPAQSRRPRRTHYMAFFGDYVSRPSDRSTAANGSGSYGNAHQKTSRHCIKRRLRRGSSKLLSLFGIRTSTGLLYALIDGLWRLADLTTIPLGSQCVDSTASSLTSEQHAPQLSSSSPSKEGTSVNSYHGAGWKSSNCSSESPALSPHLQQSQQLGPMPLENGNMVDAQPIPPVSNMTDLFSQKLSVAFDSSTIIHRSHLQQRPNIVTFERCVLALSTPHLHDGSGGHEAPIDGSSFPANGWPTISASETSSDYPSHSKYTTPDNDPGCESIPSAGDSPTRGSIGSNTASIVTVETAALAKVFFETYFDDVFTRTDARLQRQCELESYLCSFPFTIEEKIQAWRDWLSQERDHLRQYRALKRRSNCFHREQACPAAAGYESLKVLGKGSFGVVRLVREKRQGEVGRGTSSGQEDQVLQGSEPSHTRTSLALGALRSAIGSTWPCHSMESKNTRLFAMKVIRKSNMLRHAQEGHLRAERDFLVASENSRWIVSLAASFQDCNNLYLVMDYMVGGDFLGLLLRTSILKESVTKWYVAEIVLCIEEVHRLGWIHRDVKPDNFLISASGHLKISDFGLAFDGYWDHEQAYYDSHRKSLLEKLNIKVNGDGLDQEEATKVFQKKKAYRDSVYDSSMVGLFGPLGKTERRQFAKSIVGTSQYMAPELLRGRSYDARCDWWSVGIVLYEVLTNRHESGQACY